MSSKARRRKVKYREKKVKHRQETGARPSPMMVSQAAEPEAQTSPATPRVAEATPVPRVAVRSHVLLVELRQVGILGGAVLAVLVLLAIILS